MNTARSSLLVAVVIPSLLFLTGCSAVVSGMVQSQLNMNSSGPDFTVSPAVAGLGEAERFYAELLADADDDFASFKGERFTAEEKREAISSFADTFERNTQRQVDRGLVAADFADSLVKQLRRGFKRGEYVHLNRSAPGATSVGWSKTAQQQTAVNLIYTTVGVSFRYPIASKEEGRQVLKQLEGVFNRVIAERSKWVIMDLAGKRAEYVEYAGLYAQNAKLSGRPSPYDFDTLAAGPISTMTFTYRWTSQAVLNTGGIQTPAIDLVLVNVHNNLEDLQYNYQQIMNGGNIEDGSYVIVSVTKSTAVNGD